MNYEWLQSIVMGLIFLAAMLFAVNHFMPEFFPKIRRLLARKNNRVVAINLVASNAAGSCQTRCSACNGCSLAKTG